jgi:hypothetical protein
MGATPNGRSARDAARDWLADAEQRWHREESDPALAATIALVHAVLSLADEVVELASQHPRR